ncbi:type II toxin-antitoxin system Phd/YefM family antitoxin [Methylobacterium aquaticum]|uniref:type II toxin-antitoxin system Phd/YefM family antitoxin n=1 Tax=Methylobacterium aquaticum TaxID=270351 RepID=UPI003D17097B
MADEETKEGGPERVGLRKVQANLADYLDQARQGRTFIVTSQGEPIAEIHPPRPDARSRRRPGALAGRIHLTEEDDAVVPETRPVPGDEA